MRLSCTLLLKPAGWGCPVPGIHAIDIAMHDHPKCCLFSSRFGHVQGGLRRCSGADKHLRVTFIANSVKDAKVVRTPSHLMSSTMQRLRCTPLIALCLAPTGHACRTQGLTQLLGCSLSSGAVHERSLPLCSW